jgi:hypothetical protein
LQQCAEKLRELTAALTSPAASDEFERGRLQGMEQERALWQLSAEAQAEGAYAPAEPAQAQGEPVAEIVGTERRGSASVELPPLPEPTHHLVRIVTDAGPTTYFTAPGDPRGYPVYTADQLRAAASVERVPLTEEQIRQAVRGAGLMFTGPDIKVARAIEAAHGIGAPATTGEQT